MRILIVDDETLVRKSLVAQIQSFDPEKRHEVLAVSSVKEAVVALDNHMIDLALIDLTLDDSVERAGLKILREIRQSSPSTVAVAMTGHDEARLIEDCIRAGASDYLLKPFDANTIEQVLRKAPVLHRMLRKTETLRVKAGDSFLKPLELTSKSAAYNAMLALAKKMKGTNHSILIRGESGSGKEVLAQYLWSLEDEASRPFIPVNCGAISATLAESELFGHKKGAFSGATEDRAGKFESADGGDIFLDELATLPMDIQVKLLRVLSSGDIQAVGKDKSKKVSCRVIAATNENLEEMIKEKSFREDLLFRVKQFTLTIPPLRERREDIMDLANQFLRAQNYPEKSFSKSAEKLLTEYSWPGNVRELKSAVEVAAVLSDGNEIKAEDIRPHLMQASTPPALDKVVTQEMDVSTIEGSFNHLVREFESKLIDMAMKHKGSEVAAAKFLGVPRSTLGDIRRRLKAGK